MTLSYRDRLVGVTAQFVIFERTHWIIVALGNVPIRCVNILICFIGTWMTGFACMQKLVRGLLLAWVNEWCLWPCKINKIFTFTQMTWWRGLSIKTFSSMLIIHICFMLSGSHFLVAEQLYIQPCMSVCLSVCPSFCLPVYMSVCLKFVKREALQHLLDLGLLYMFETASAWPIYLHLLVFAINK